MVLNLTKASSLRALLGVLFLMVSSSSYAAYEWSTIKDGTWGYGGTGHGAASDWCSKEGGCSTINSTGSASGPVREFWNVKRNGESHWEGLTVYRSTIDSCEDSEHGLIYTDSEGNCTSEEPSSCPAGTTNLGTVQEPDCQSYCNPQASRSYTFELTVAPVAGFDGMGCGLQMNPNVKPDCYQKNDDIMCSFVYGVTGQHDGTGTEEGDPNAFYEPGDSETSTNTADESGSFPQPQQTDSETYDKSPATTSTEPDGSATTEFTETETTVKDAGTTVKKLGDNLYRYDSTGQIIEIVKQHEINSYPSGASDKTITETLTATPANIIETVKDMVSGQTSQQTYQQGKTGSTSKTTHTQYDESGGVTSSETTGSTTGEEDLPCVGDCDGEGGDGEGEKSDFVVFEGQGDFDDATQEALSAQQQALADLQGTINTVKSEASALFNANIATGSGGLPCPEPVIFNLGVTPVEFDLCLANYEEDLSLIKIILLFIAAFLAIVIILR